MKPELSKYVQVDLSPPRVARLWDNVAPRLAATANPRRAWMMRAAVMGSLLVAAGGGAALYSLREPAPSVWQNAVLRTGGDAMSVNLGEGSTLELASESRVEVAESAKDSVRLNLAQGSVLCDVTHRAGRRFTVATAGVEVRVVGTRFRVALAPSGERVEVEVERGTVEVTALSDPGHVRRLSAGERWSVAQNAAPAAPEPSATPAAATEDVNDAAPVESAAPMEPEAADTRGLPRGDKDAPARESTSTLEVANAKQLLDLANSARRSGDIPLAARAYEALVSRFPRDGRSGLAAFELGRLRLERLGNAKGAAQAFERAIALAPGSGFREDAMARLVDSYAAMGAVSACRRARQAYLERYPAGLHVNGVSAKCAGR